MRCSDTQTMVRVATLVERLFCKNPCKSSFLGGFPHFLPKNALYQARKRLLQAQKNRYSSPYLIRHPPYRKRITMKIGSLDRISIYRMATVIAALTALSIMSIIVITPFIPAILLAVIFALSAWPAYSWLEQKLQGRRTLAASLMTLILALCFILPLTFLAASLADNFVWLSNDILTLVQNPPPEPPAWLATLPHIGPQIVTKWHEYTQDTGALTTLLVQQTGPATKTVASIAGTVGRGAVDLSLGVLIAFFLFRNGVEAAERLSVLIGKFLGTRGQHLLKVSKSTMIGVVYGMMGTAVAQGTLSAIGFMIAGVPAPIFLGFVTFILSFLPLGAPLIWVPATIWLFAEGYTGMGIFMGLWGLLAVSSIDNIIRPYFISLGSNLPLLVTLLGVFGGIIAFGFIGLFIGPTLLAVAYTLIIEWSYDDKKEPAAAIPLSDKPAVAT